MAADSGAGKNGTRLFFLCFLAYSFSYIGRMNYSACMPAMIDAAVFDKAFGGAVTTAYLVCYGAGQFINGTLGAKISPKFMIAAGLCGAGLMNICMGLTGGKYLILLIWALNGFFQSMLWSPVIRCFAEWLPEDRRNRAGLNISLSIPCGTVAAYLIPSVILYFFNYNFVFFICGSLMLTAAAVWIIGIYFLGDYISRMSRIFKENKSATANGDNPAAKPAEEMRSEDSASSAEISRNMEVEKSGITPGNPRGVSLFSLLTAGGLFVAVVGILFNGALKDAVSGWVPTFLKENFGVSPSAASLISTFLPLVSVFGAYVAVWINRRFTGNELMTNAVLFALSLLSMLAQFFFGKYNIILSAFFFAVSVSSMWGINTMFLTFIPFRFARIGKSSTVTGFLNSCSYAASSLSGYLYGVSAANIGWENTVLIWVAVGLCGAAVCVIGGKIWGERRSLYE